jgi:hypothetical protein
MHGRHKKDAPTNAGSVRWVCALSVEAAASRDIRPWEGGIPVASNLPYYAYATTYRFEQRRFEQKYENPIDLKRSEHE